MWVKAHPDITEGSSHSVVVTGKKQRETGTLRIEGSVQIRSQEGGGHSGECSRTFYSMKCSGVQGHANCIFNVIPNKLTNLGSHK